MSTIIERPSFNVRAYQKRTSIYRSSAGVDVLPIIFHHYKVLKHYNPSIHGYDLEPPIFISKNTLKLRFSRERVSGSAKITMERLARYKRVIARSPRNMDKLQMKLARYLCRHVRVPEDKHPFIIADILNVLETAVPDKIIDVQLLDVTIRETEESLHMNVEDNFYRTKLIPATKSFIDGLEKVRLLEPDSLEMLGLESSCAICKEAYAEKKGIAITRLPCLHYYHQDCIVQWLKINHVCPICRHPNAPSR
ncbi:hypothetical protein M0R45_012123 [Rubus argutus]|uniref:RING-type E3 ubiquitin transferase n=1 Tax=Rubus argutus TaxID=59490 RepID=A0AAW1YCD3_RUBAR